MSVIARLCRAIAGVLSRVSVREFYYSLFTASENAYKPSRENLYPALQQSRSFRFRMPTLSPHSRSVALGKRPVDGQPPLEAQYYPSDPRFRVSIEINRSAGLRSFNAIPTTPRTDIMLQPERFTAATADIHGIGFIHLLSIDE
jgi:hypothetical protein